MQIRALDISFHDFAAYNQLLYFAGSFANGAQLRVAVKFLYRKIFGVAIAAKHLHGIGRYFHGNLRGIILRKSDSPWSFSCARSSNKPPAWSATLRLLSW
jgi:hypothetical protein